MAVLVPIAEEWHDLALHALAINTGIWGGSGNILVPYDPVSGAIDEAIVELVRRFDPDIWGDYHHTLRALELSSPDGFGKLVAERLVGHETDEWNREQVERDLRGFNTHGGAPESVLSQLRTFSAPTWDRGYGAPAWLATDSAPHDTAGLLTDAAKLTPLPARVIQPTLSRLPADVQVLFAGRFGLLNPGVRDALRARDVFVSDVVVPANEEHQVLQTVWGANDGTGQWSVGYELAQYRSGYARFAPGAPSEQGLSLFIPMAFQLHVAPIPIVVGSTLNDFAYAHALQRDLGAALWLPERLIPHEDFDPIMVALSAALRRIAGNGQERPVAVVSRSLPAETLVDLANRLQTATHCEAVAANSVPLPAERGFRLLAQENDSYPSGTAFIDATGSMLNHLTPGLPGVLTENPADMVWWNDVTHPTNRLPARWALNDHLLVDRHGFNDPLVRASRDGVTFASQTRSFIPAGATLGHLLARPRLRFLNGTAVFQALADEAGATLIESDKGAYSRLAVELWGGLPALLVDVQPGSARQLLEAWQSTVPSGDAPGNWIPNRRYLSISDMMKVLAPDPAQAADDEPDRLAIVQTFTDRMLRRGVIRRGQCLKCAVCRHFAWYDADDVGNTFRCARCRATAVVDSLASRSGEADITWYYQLHEAVYQAFHHNFIVPMLAVGMLAKRARSVLWMPEHKVQLPAACALPALDAEVDLWVVADGRIILGEAKSNGALAAAKSRRTAPAAAATYERLADAFTADEVVFVTSKAKWDESTVSAVEHAFKGSRVKFELRSLDQVAADAAASG